MLTSINPDLPAYRPSGSCQLISRFSCFNSAGPVWFIGSDQLISLTSALAALSYKAFPAPHYVFFVNKTTVSTWHESCFYINILPGTRIHFAKRTSILFFSRRGNMSAYFYGHGNMSKNWNLSTFIFRLMDQLSECMIKGIRFYRF
jgi:hypothetical protein